MNQPEHPLFARLYDPVMSIAERTLLTAHREYLAADLSGRVLDLGAGTGAMFPYFETVSGDVSVTAIEPDPHMREQARERANQHSIDITFSAASAETLPFEDGTFDAVVASFVFCTIPDHERALAEVARVLDGDGEFRFLEHVRSDGLGGHVQDLLAPGWHAVAGGCHLNRRIDELFLRDSAFQTAEFRRLESDRFSLFPMVRGRLERSSRSPIGRIRNLLR